MLKPNPKLGDKTDIGSNQSKPKQGGGELGQQSHPQLKSHWHLIAVGRVSFLQWSDIWYIPTPGQVPHPGVISRHKLGHGLKGGRVGRVAKWEDRSRGEYEVGSVGNRGGSGV